MPKKSTQKAPNSGENLSALETRGVTQIFPCFFKQPGVTQNDTKGMTQEQHCRTPILFSFNLNGPQHPTCALLPQFSNLLILQSYRNRSQIGLRHTWGHVAPFGLGWVRPAHRGWYGGPFIYSDNSEGPKAQDVIRPDLGFFGGGGGGLCRITVGKEKTTLLTLFLTLFCPKMPTFKACSDLAGCN